MEEELISLSKAAEILGVHPSTVRSWSNQGKLPVQRTAGGHRRYSRKDIALWKQIHFSQETRDLEQMIPRMIHQVRLQISEGLLESETWYMKLTDETREHFRISGRKLSTSMLHYLTAPETYGMSEAQSIGYEYAVRCYQVGLDQVDATRAFLFFRNALLESVLKTYETAHIYSPVVWSEMLRKFHRFTDQVLLGLLDHYVYYPEGQR